MLHDIAREIVNSLTRPRSIISFWIPHLFCCNQNNKAPTSRSSHSICWKHGLANAKGMWWLWCEFYNVPKWELAWHTASGPRPQQQSQITSRWLGWLPYKAEDVSAWFNFWSATGLLPSSSPQGSPYHNEQGLMESQWIAIISNVHQCSDLTCWNTFHVPSLKTNVTTLVHQNEQPTQASRSNRSMHNPWEQRQRLHIYKHPQTLKPLWMQWSPQAISWHLTIAMTESWMQLLMLLLACYSSVPIRSPGPSVLIEATTPCCRILNTCKAAELLCWCIKTGNREVPATGSHGGDQALPSTAHVVWNFTWRWT